MSATRTYEGPDIESVLAVVREREGASARIVSADKQRRGGVGGFFAKEVYVVTVADADGDADDADPFRSLLDDREDRDFRDRRAFDALTPNGSGDDHRSMMDSLLALADDTSERERGGAPLRHNIGSNWRPRNFDDVLANARRIAAQVERDLDLTDATRQREAFEQQRQINPIEVAGLPGEPDLVSFPIQVNRPAPTPSPASPASPARASSADRELVAASGPLADVLAEAAGVTDALAPVAEALVDVRPDEAAAKPAPKKKSIGPKPKPKPQAAAVDAPPVVVAIEPEPEPVVVEPAAIEPVVIEPAPDPEPEQPVVLAPPVGRQPDKSLPPPVVESFVNQVSLSKNLTPAQPKSRRGYKLRRGRKGGAEIDGEPVPMIDIDLASELVTAPVPAVAAETGTETLVNAPAVVAAAPAPGLEPVLESMPEPVDDPVDDPVTEPVIVLADAPEPKPVFSPSVEAIVEGLLNDPEMTLASIRWSDSDERAETPVEKQVPQSRAPIPLPPPVVSTAAVGAEPPVVPAAPELPEVPPEFQERLDTIEAIARLPHAAWPASDRTGVIAVLGTVDDAVALARRHSRDVLVASRQSPGPGVPRWLWIPDSADARSRARRWAGLDKAVVIVVESSAALDDDGWTAAMLDALGPVHIRLAASATMGRDEIDPWMRSLAASMIPVASVDFLDAP
ncbi:MAG: hypothetical protein AB7L13_04635 [Acidimicrobiia bacterium]